MKTAIALTARRYLAPTIVVILVTAAGMGYVWSEYRALLKEKDQLAADRASFNEEVLRSEKHRGDAALALIAQKADIEKREFVLQQLEGQNKERLAALQQKATEYESAFRKLQDVQSSVGQAQRLKEVEEKIQKQMSEFTAMGVNLNTPVHCNDSDGLAKFNVAKAKYTEIYTLAEAYGFAQRYRNFFFHNGQNVGWSCRNG